MKNISELPKWHWKNRAVEYIDEILSEDSPQITSEIYSKLMIMCIERNNRSIKRSISQSKMVRLMMDNFPEEGYKENKKEGRKTILWGKRK